MRRSTSRFAVTTILSAGAACTSTRDLDNDRQGFVLGGGIIGALEHFDLSDQEAGAGTNITVEQPTLGYEARVGYRFHPAIAVEAVYQYYEEFEFERHGAVDFGDGRVWAAAGNVKAYLLPGPVQPYLLAGLGAVSMKFDDDLQTGLDVDETTLMWRYGGGLDVYLSRSVLLYGECTYNLPFDDLEEFPYLAVGAGVQYRF